MTEAMTEELLKRIEGLLDAKLQTIGVRVDAVNEASVARSKAIADRQQDQRGDIRANTRAIGELTAQTSRVEREMQVATERLREHFREAIREEIAGLSVAFVQREELDRRAMEPAEDHARRLDRLEKLVALSLGFAAGSFGYDLLPLFLSL